MFVAEKIHYRYVGLVVDNLIKLQVSTIALCAVVEICISNKFWFWTVLSVRLRLESWMCRWGGGRGQKPRPIASTHNNIYWGCLRDMLSCFINRLQTSCQKINPNHNINYTSVYKPTSEYEHRVRMPRVLMEWRTWSLRSRLIWYSVYNVNPYLIEGKFDYFLSWCDIKGIFNLYNLKKNILFKDNFEAYGHGMISSDII